MFHTELVVRADDCPIQQTPDGFDGVGMNVATDPFLGGVVDCLMDRVLIPDAVITGVGVGVDRYRFVGDIGSDEVVEDMSGGIRAAGDTEADVAAPLDSAQDHRLVGPVLSLGASRPNRFRQLRRFQATWWNRLP